MLRLSRAMAYKNALCGLDHGGGKAVIIGDPATDKSEALLRAYGRFVESLGGRYVTACDVGTYVADMDVIAKETRFATGRSEANGGAGDSSVLTAYGVFQGMCASAAHVWGNPSLAGKTVGIAGVGKVGRLLAALLLENGARVVVTDVNSSAVEALREKHREIDVAADVFTLVRSELDVYAPCALGGALDDDDRRGVERQGGVRSSQQPARRGGRRRNRRGPDGSWHHVCAGLPGQCRRRDPGQRRAPWLQLRSGQTAHRGHLRRDDVGAARRRRQGNLAGGGCGSPR